MFDQFNLPLESLQNLWLIFLKIVRDSPRNMLKSPENSSLVRAQSENVALWLSIIGLLLTVTGNAIEYTIWKVSVGGVFANVGALFLIIGVLQWFFDRKVRHDFFADIREEIIGSHRIAASGISDFYEDSKNVELTEHFLSSQELVVGVNYSAKLIDNSISLLEARTERKLKTTIIAVDPECDAAKFLAADYQIPEIATGINKIRQIVMDIDPKSEWIDIKLIKTVLRYSFIKFDGRIWVVIGTNGRGRRAVPGFFVSQGRDWFNHFADDISKLSQRT